ncbi:GDYXXLXY domain-containing protein [Methylophaga sulfidovorans]|uniref:Uncharacterized membrane-anchored protein n=1 Tax=Methylophaga sulfidovorans TaxID=45496 RepID=A0A1I3Z7A4_9GAMM|nr:GDYXXLXY domain-containing protein [Methylophaga sulfidovorans]SFK39925.1 Uncharacterized membrane-anchored protein [Methylophaga sulfidovorans]
MKLAKIISVLSLLVILLAVNWSIYRQEQVLTQGKTVLLKLMPVDPRSLMQGDYMELNFELANQIRRQLIQQNTDTASSGKLKTQDGYVVVKINQNQEGEFVRIDDGEALAENELRLFFRVRHGKIKFASNGFFFQEGKASEYENAKFGEFKVGEDGNLLLVDLTE